MADNVLQSLKDLNKALDSADVKAKALAGDVKTVLNTIIKEAGSSRDAINALIAEISKKNLIGAKTIDIVTRLVDKNGNPLTPESIEAVINKVKKSSQSFSLGLFEYDKSNLSMLQKMFEYSKKDASDLLATVLKITNAFVGKGKDNKGTLLGQERKRVLEEQRLAIKKLAEEQQHLLELEQQLGKYKEGSKNWRDTKAAIEATTKQIEIYKQKVDLLQGRAVKDPQAEAERNYINMLRERQQLEEKSLRLRLQLQNAQLAGKVSPEFLSRSTSQLVDNAGKIAVLEERLQKEKVQLTAEGQRRIEEMTLAHQNKLTNITNQGEQSRLRIEERNQNNLSKEARDEANRQLAMWEAEVKNRQELAKQQQKQKDDAARAEAKEYRTAVSQQEKNFRILQHYLNERRKLQSQINKHGYGATNEQNTLMSIYNKRIQDTVRSMRQLENAHKGVTAEASKNTMQERMKSVDATTKQISRNLRQTKQDLTNLIPVVQRLASALGVAFSIRGLAQFGKKLIETRGEFELQQVALRSILQNKQVADEIWDKTMQAALQSPFTAMQLTKYTKQLAAYRIETEKLFDTTKRLADVSAGLGVDMQRLILAYGQVKAANYLRASEIRQFTEAGVNILGELSQYFTETRGQIISTAQVMDMVQKRLVKFKDVEAIFQRMTDQGGIFYNMQYVQSQTVKGQINKLHDAYDQMLNGIGKANEGVLKNMVSLLNNIVKNWREWKTVLDTIAFPLIIVSLAKFSKGLFTVGSAARIASKEIKGLELVGTKLRNVIGNINPWMIAFEVITAATFAIWNHAKAVKAANEELDELSRRNYETMASIDDTANAIEKNNATLRTAKKNSKEYKEAQKENNSLVNKLKSDYPELTDAIKVNAEGIVTMTKELEKYNAELRLQIRLQQLSKSSFGNQGFGKDATQFGEEEQKRVTKLQENLTNIDIDIQQTKAKLADATNELEKSTLRNIITSLESIKRSVIYAQKEGLDAIAVYNKAYDDFLQKYKKHKRGGHYDFPETKMKRVGENTELSEMRTEVQGQTSQYLQYTTDLLKIFENFRYDVNDAVLTDKSFIKKYRTNIQDQLYTIGKDGQVIMGELGYALSEAFMKSAERATTDAGRNSLLKLIIEDFEKETGLNFKFALKQSTNNNNNPLDLDPNGKGKDSANRMISLLKEMNSEYGKLAKSAYGYAKAEAKVRESFERSFEEIFKVKGGTGQYINLESTKFETKQDLANALQALYDSMKAKNAFARFTKGTEEELLKAISMATADVDIETAERVREDFQREIEDMFGDMELTLELTKLNIPGSVLKDMYGMDMVDTADIRAKLNEWYEKMGADRNEEFFKQYQQYLRKLDDEERKLQKQRLKDYSKYLEYQLSERAKLEMDYVRKLAEVQSETAFNDTQKRQIGEGLKREYDEAIAKQDWEDFKGSEFYIGMFEDLEKQSTASLEIMRKALLELRENAKNLRPRAMKELVKDLEKIDEIERNRKPPFQRMREEAEKLNKALDDANISGIREAFEQLAYSQDMREKQQDYLDTLETVIGAKQAEIKVTEALKDADKATTGYALKDAKEMLKIRRDIVEETKKERPSNVDTEDFRQWEYDLNEAERLFKEMQNYVTALELYEKVKAKSKELGFENVSLETLLGDKDNIKAQLKLTDEQIAELEKLRDTWDRLKKAEDDALQSLIDYMNTVKGVISSTIELTHIFGWRENNPLTEYWDDAAQAALDYAAQTIEALKKFKQAADTATKLGENLATGDYIGLALQLLGVLLQIVNKIGLFRGAKIDKEIQDQQTAIDNLTMAYDRLNKSIERTLDTVSYMSDMDKMAENIRQQIAATEAQLAAAQSRKNADESEVSGYKKSLYDLYDQLEELRQKQLEVFGGIGKDNYRSWAEGFVSAWKDAFLETGDGLDALQDHFDEFLQEWFVKQATMRIAGKALEGIMGDIDRVVSDDGVVDWNELQRIREQMAALLPDLNEKLTDFAGMFGLGDKGGLSGLAAGIQGMTEEQANILEAYWNSVRGYTASIDTNVARIATILGAGGSESNPMLQQMNLIAANTQATHQLLQSVTKSGHTLGGYGIKVFSD